MKKTIKIIAIISILSMVICAFSAVSFADYDNDMSINAGEAVAARRKYLICGLEGEYLVSGNSVGYDCPNIKADVEGAQAGLQKIDYYYSAANCDPGTIDGLFGSKTYYAVRNFQTYTGLSCDGVVGPNTWEKLESMTNNE